MPHTIVKLWSLGVAALMLSPCNPIFGQSMQNQNPYVRIAEIEVDPAQLESYQRAVAEEIEDSIRLEAGVLTLYAVADKDHPVHIRIFEIYANMDAYKAHLETPHFKKYKLTVEPMVKSLKLVDTVPIRLGAKAK